MTDVEAHKFDDVFAEVAGRLGGGGLPALFDAFFGFLQRRTDFYIEADPAAPAPMGFPPGVAKKLLISSFEKYPIRNYRDTVQYQQSSPAANSPQYTPSSVRVAPPTSASSRLASPAVAAAETPKARSTPSAPVGVLQTPIGNGGIGLGYYWTQTLREINVYIDVEPGKAFLLVQTFVLFNVGLLIQLCCALCRSQEGGRWLHDNQ
jgi:hypothetical protein